MLWIKLLMKKPCSIARIIERLEKAIQRVACYPFAETEKQISFILDATEKKARLIELASLGKSFALALTEQEKENVSAMLKENKLSCAKKEDGSIAARRTYKRTLKTAQNVLFLLGYTPEELEKRFGFIASL